MVDNNPIRLINWGCQSDTNTYGVVIFDPSGNNRVVLGERPNGDPRNRVARPFGEQPRVVAGQGHLCRCDTANDLGDARRNAGSPSITINIGSSGDCEIIAGAFVGSATKNSSTAYLVIDGVNEGSIFGMGSGSSVAGNVPQHATNLVVAALVYPLSAGSHTFTMLYESSTGGTAAQFSDNHLKVQPL